MTKDRLKEKIIISIEMMNDVKYIHYIGSNYKVTEQTDKPWTYAEYCGLAYPLDDALLYGITKWANMCEQFLKPSITRLSSDENDKQKWWNYEFLKAKDITRDIECGFYCIY